MLFVWRGSVLNRIVPQMVFTAALATVVTATHGLIGGWKLALNPTPFLLLGVSLAIFLGFRNSTSYDRFWEARRLWGALLNDSRSVARQVMTLTSCPPERRQKLVYLLIAFTHALRHQLRGTDASADLTRLLPTAEATRLTACRFKPAMALVLFSETLTAARRDGEIDPILTTSVEPGLSGLSHTLGGCERIASTPLPFTYAVIIHRTTYLYCFLLPFGLVDSIGWFTPVIVSFVAYCFFALEALSDELEDPFGTMPNDLALDAMADNIEATLRETLGEPLPPRPPRDERTWVLT